MRHFTVGEKLALILTFEKANLNFKTLSLNVRGFRSQGKRKALLIWLGKQNADVDPRTYMPTHTPTVVQGKEGVVGTPPSVFITSCLSTSLCCFTTTSGLEYGYESLKYY